MWAPNLGFPRSAANVVSSAPVVSSANLQPALAASRLMTRVNRHRWIKVQRPVTTLPLVVLVNYFSDFSKRFHLGGLRGGGG